MQSEKPEKIICEECSLKVVGLVLFDEIEHYVEHLVYEHDATQEDIQKVRKSYRIQKAKEEQNKLEDKEELREVLSEMQ